MNEIHSVRFNIQGLKEDDIEALRFKFPDVFVTVFDWEARIEPSVSDSIVDVAEKIKNVSEFIIDRKQKR